MPCIWGTDGLIRRIQVLIKDPLREFTNWTSWWFEEDETTWKKIRETQHANEKDVWLSVPVQMLKQLLCRERILCVSVSYIFKRRRFLSMLINLWIIFSFNQSIKCLRIVIKRPFSFLKGKDVSQLLVQSNSQFVEKQKILCTEKLKPMIVWLFFACKCVWLLASAHDPVKSFRGSLK